MTTRLLLFCCFALLSTTVCGQPGTGHARSGDGRLLDAFDDSTGWQVIVSDGVEAKLQRIPGVKGQAMALDFEFHAGAGYAIAQKRLPLDLPANYKFSFYLRGETPSNNFEFKLLDSLGNVYWIKQLNIDYPRDWKRRVIKKRHLSFAWGPAGGGMPEKIDRIEFVVSAGSGGRGQICIDEFRFAPIDESAPASPPKVDVSSFQRTMPRLLPDGSAVENWRSTTADSQWLLLDFKREREVGGLVLDWHGDDFATAYTVESSDDGSDWWPLYSVLDGNGGRDYLYLPEAEARFIRLRLHRSRRGQGFALARLAVKDADFSATANEFFSAIAAEAPRGLYPPYFLSQQAYWTVAGASGDRNEALLSETGAIEIDKGGFTLEPFLYLNGHLRTWHDATRRQSLAQDYLPIPSVHWDDDSLALTITACAAGEPGRSVLIATYEIENRRTQRASGKLLLALRPFQVLPPWQALNLTGGTTRIDSIRFAGDLVIVNSDKRLFPVQLPDAFGATTFDQGDISEYLQHGRIPGRQRVADQNGFASAALQFAFDLAPGQTRRIDVVIPFHNTPAPDDGWPVARLIQETHQFWQAKLAGVDLRLPRSAQAIANTFKSQLAYILINRDGPAIQPGSRTYERAWIRDGSLTSTALLQTGFDREVRDYLEWYAPHQYPSGKIPCVVDERGADPVPEHDSHGQFIYAVMEYYRFTRDTAWLREMFPRVVLTVRYLQSLRRERMTDEYRFGTPEQRACFGLVPESISHEGYSAKPMHSYWDDFFVLRGLKDAASMAAILGEAALVAEFAAERDDFRRALYASMRLAMTNHDIDYIPGCVELGDFDATSTTVGLNPVNELGNIPEPQLHNTFERYYHFFRARQRGEIDWRDYTPYEVRLIGSFVLLDQKERAHELLEFFMRDRRPAGWNHWAEVVWRDAAAPRFIGDMPHTWVGSDFVRAIRTMLVYEREHDQALVVGAGIPEAWLDDPAGLEADGLPTYFGRLNVAMRRDGEDLVVRLKGDVEMPPGKIVLKSPMRLPIQRATINGNRIAGTYGVEIVVDQFPATVVLSFASQ